MNEEKMLDIFERILENQWTIMGALMKTGSGQQLMEKDRAVISMHSFKTKYLLEEIKATKASRDLK